MGEVTSTAERVIDAPVATVRAALADYEEVRPRILTSQFSDYGVESGGHGAGTRAHWKLAATKKRVRDCRVDVVESVDGSIVERDANSSMVTTWRVEPVAAVVAAFGPPRRGTVRVGSAGSSSARSPRRASRGSTTGCWRTWTAWSAAERVHEVGGTGYPPASTSARNARTTPR